MEPENRQPRPENRQPRPENRQPRIEVEGKGCRPTPRPFNWTCTWRIRNLEDSPAQILTTWLPHDRFISENQEHHPPLDLPVLGSIDLEAVVRCSETAGTVIENAFVILRVAFRGSEWRVFARQEVRVDNQGAPQATCQLVTCQPVGNPDAAG